METADTANERTPLLGDVTDENSLGQLPRISATSSEETPSDENAASNGEAPLDENGAVPSEQLPSSGQGPRTFDPETNEVSLEEVVKALFSAWEQNSERSSYTVLLNTRSTGRLEYFSTKDLCAMHLAWKNVTSGRSCSSQPHEIAEALASAICGTLHNPIIPERYEDDDESLNNLYTNTTIEKCFIAANFLAEWEKIADGFGFPVRYIETVKTSEESPLTVSEFCLRQVELYDKAHDFFRNPKLRAILFSLVIIWPISISIVGSKYMECHLSYLLIALGCIGCFAALGRLALLSLEAKNPNELHREWIFLRVVEFTFLVVFIVEAFYFFKTDSGTEPDPNQCGNFYTAALVINYASVAFASAYVLAYSVKICRKQFDFWQWIFKHF